MKRLFLGSVALVALSLGTTAAFAADRGVPAYAPPPAPVPAYTNWSGCYVGASAGESSGRSNGFTTTGGSTFLSPAGPVPLGGTPNGVVAGGIPITSSFNLSGFIGGFQGGCNWQAGMWVIGIEGDGSATNKEGQAFWLPQTIPSSVGPLTTVAGSVSSLQERWLATARGRLGLAGWWGEKSMIYVTGGGAWAKIDSNQYVVGVTGVFTPITTALIQTDTRSGWTVGGGLEYSLGYGWSAKAEYLYVDFGHWTTFTRCVVAGFTCPATSATRLDVNLNDHIFRAGLNYKFW